MPYRGRRRRAERHRLRDIAARHWTASPPGAGDSETTGPRRRPPWPSPPREADETQRQATQAAVHAATHAWGWQNKSENPSATAQAPRLIIEWTADL